MVAIMTRGVHTIRADKHAEGLELEKRVREVALRMGYPTRIYVPLFAPLPNSSWIVERDWGSVGAWESGLAKLMADPEWQALGAQFSGMGRRGHFELYVVLGIERRPWAGKATVLQRTLHRVVPDKWDELMALEAQFDAVNTRLGTPSRRRYMAYTVDQSVEVVEREWERFPFELLTQADHPVDPELAALLKQAGPMIEETRTELYRVV
jgi:hypothetical protein